MAYFSNSSESEKNKNKMKKKIKGIALILLSMAIAWGSTYLYDLIAGNEGRAIIFVMYTGLTCVSFVAIGLVKIID